MPLAQKIILLLKYLPAEHDIPYSGDEMLFEILHFDWFDIPAIEIAKLTMEVATKNMTMTTLPSAQTYCTKKQMHQPKIFSHKACMKD